MRILATVLLLFAFAAGAPSLAAPRAIDVSHSKITVYVTKQGLFSFLADNHVIAAPIAAGACDKARKQIDLTVSAAKMLVLDPKLDAGRRAQVQSNMTGPQVLDVAKYPTIAFRSTSINESNANRWVVSGNLTLHGQTHPITFQLRKLDANRFSGSVTIRQTAFGITPIKIAGGTVRVKDNVTVSFQVALKP